MRVLRIWRSLSCCERYRTCPRLAASLPAHVATVVPDCRLTMLGQILEKRLVQIGISLPALGLCCSDHALSHPTGNNVSLDLLGDSINSKSNYIFVIGSFPFLYANSSLTTVADTSLSPQSADECVLISSLCQSCWLKPMISWSLSLSERVEPNYVLLYCTDPLNLCEKQHIHRLLRLYPIIFSQYCYDLTERITSGCVGLK